MSRKVTAHVIVEKGRKEQLEAMRERLGLKSIDLVIEHLMTAYARMVAAMLETKKVAE